MPGRVCRGARAEVASARSSESLVPWKRCLMKQASITVPGRSPVEAHAGKQRAVGWSMKASVLGGLAITAAVLAAGAMGHAEDPAEPTDAQVASQLGLALDQVRLLHDYRKLTNAALLK